MSDPIQGASIPLLRMRATRVAAGVLFVAFWIVLFSQHSSGIRGFVSALFASQAVSI